MFRKNKANENTSETFTLTVPSVVSGPEKDVMPADKILVQEEKSNNTVIASGVCFEGNINAGGQIYVYGTIVGNVDLAEGLVKVMRNGMVEGNIQSRELIVDGCVKGHCQAESIDICENGRIDGTLAYVGLSIKKGGVFTGRAEQQRQPEIAVNVVDLKYEVIPASAEGEKSARAKKNA